MVYLNVYRGENNTSAQVSNSEGSDWTCRIDSISELLTGIEEIHRVMECSIVHNQHDDDYFHCDSITYDQAAQLWESAGGDDAEDEDEEWEYDDEEEDEDTDDDDDEDEYLPFSKEEHKAFGYLDTPQQPYYKVLFLDYNKGIMEVVTSAIVNNNAAAYNCISKEMLCAAVIFFKGKGLTLQKCKPYANQVDKFFEGVPCSVCQNIDYIDGRCYHCGTGYAPPSCDTCGGLCTAENGKEELGMAEHKYFKALIKYTTLRHRQQQPNPIRR